MIGFIIRQAGEIEVNGPDGVERINGLLLEGDVSHIRLAAVWFGERVSIAPIVSPSPSQVAPQPQAGELVAVGYVDPADTARKSSVGEPLRFWCSPVKTTCFSMPLYASPQPANPAQVTELIAKYRFAPDRPLGLPTAGKTIAVEWDDFLTITAAIGAGGQAVEEAAKRLAAWIGYSWDGLPDESAERRGLPEWAYNGIGDKNYQGGKEGLRRLVAELSALSQSHPADERVVEALRGLLEYVDQTTCTHDSTHRGGAIWTICDDCGKQWADDEGGFEPYVDAEPVATARAILSAKEGR